MILGIISGGLTASGVQKVKLDPLTVENQLLSLADRKAIALSDTLLGGSKTIYGRKSGKLYFEAVVNNVITTANNLALIGLIRTDLPYEIAAHYGFCCGVFIAGSMTSRIWLNGEIQANLGSPSNGNRYDFAFDLDANLFWIRRASGNWNASSAANPATGTGGFSLSDLGSYDLTPAVTSDVSNQEVTFNFDPEDFAATPPSGFSAWPTDTSDDNSGLGNTTLNSLRRTGMTLSGGDLTATRTANPALARSPDPKSEGKFYFEFTAGALNASGDCCGLATPIATASNLVTNGTNCLVAYRSGSVWTGGVNRGSLLGTISTGNRIDVAVDFDANLIWFRRNGGNWNGSSTANPATGTGGILVPDVGAAPAVALGGGGSNGSSWTLNAGESAFAGSVPSGFTAGWPRKHETRPARIAYLWTGGIE